jgi:hypothetical protein
MILIPKTYAHTLDENKTVQTILHITPDDKPIENDEAILHFGIFIHEKNILIEDCKCIVSINKKGKELDRFKISENKGEDLLLYNGVAAYTFKHTGKYDINVEGEPLNGAEFPTFKQTFTTNVAKSQIEVNEFANPVLIGISGGVIFLLLFVLLLSRGIKTN